MRILYNIPSKNPPITLVYKYSRFVSFFFSFFFPFFQTRESDDSSSSRIDTVREASSSSIDPVNVSLTNNWVFGEGRGIFRRRLLFARPISARQFRFACGRESRADLFAPADQRIFGTMLVFGIENN